MFATLSNSWALVKASARVLSADKELLIFPVVSAIGALVVTATFAVPMVVADLFDSMLTGGSEGPLGYVVLFLFYVVQYTVIVFANAALVGAATIRLKGGDPTVGDGFRIAFAHLGQILGYAVIAATVGLILRWLSERGSLGRFVSSLVGLAWNLAVFLVVPVLVLEDVGPLEAVRRSTALLKKTWGEQIAGNFGLGAVFGLLFFGLILGGGGAIALLIAGGASLPLIIAVGLILIVALLLTGLVQSALSAIYTAAVYQYAATGETGDFYKRELVAGAFKPALT